MPRLLLAGLLGLVVALPATAQPRRAPDAPAAPAPLERRVRFEQEVICQSAAGTGWLADVELRIPLPQSDDRQKIHDFVLDPAPDRRTRDAWGNPIAIYRRDRVDAAKPLRISWNCRVAIREQKHVVDRSRLKPLSQVPDDIRARYLGGGTKYGLDNEELKRAARSAVKDPEDAYDLAWQLNEFVRGRLTYLNDGYWEDAPSVLRNRHGSCSEYNFLFMALCRLHGLPARYVGASALRGKDPVYEDKVHHRWTEVYLPGYGWFPIDVSRNDGEDGKPVNQNFGRTSARLLVLMKGDGGDEAPLSWSYVSAISSRAIGDAKLRRRKRFVWRPTVAAPATESN